MGQCSSTYCASGEPTKTLESILSNGSLHVGCIVWVDACAHPGRAGSDSKQTPCGAPYMVKSSTWMSFGATGFLVPSNSGSATDRSFDVILASMEDGGSVVRKPLTAFISDENVQRLAVSFTTKFAPAEEAAVQEWVANLKLGRAKKLGRRVMLVGCRGKKTFVAALVAEMLMRTGRVQKAGEDLYGPSKCKSNIAWSDLTFIRLTHLSSMTSPMSGSSALKASSARTSETNSAALMQSHSSEGSINPDSTGSHLPGTSKDRTTADGASSGHLSSGNASHEVSQSTQQPVSPTPHSTPHGVVPPQAAPGGAQEPVSDAQQGQSEASLNTPPQAASANSLDSLFAALRRWSSPDPALNGSCPMPAAMTAH